MIELSLKEIPMADRRRWPTFDEIMEKLDRGILDDTTAAVSPLDLEEWEIRGEPAPQREARQQREAS
jgi:hypothetical protein